MKAKKGGQAWNSAVNYLLACGVVSSVLYVASDAAAGVIQEGYSFLDQMVSELMGIGAPTRPFLVRMFSAYSLLAAAFAIGVLGAAKARRALLVSGWALLAYVVLGGVCLYCFPMHVRGTGYSVSDSMHKILTAVSVLLIVLFVAFGAAARGRWFRVYSVATLLGLVAFGAWAAMDAPKIEANLPTPWAGLKERANIYLTMLWIAVFSIALMRKGMPNRAPKGRR